MSEPPFLPIGLPREASTADAVEERVGLHLLEALDSLDAVYKAAAFFADVADTASLAEYTLARCLDAARSDCGCLHLVDGDGMQLQGDRNGAAAALAPALLTDRRRLWHTNLWNGTDASGLLRAAGDARNLLTCPVLAGDRMFGFVALLAPASSPFSSADAKLVAAVCSQAAIALSRAERHRDAENERQKLLLVMQKHHDGIAVLDGRGRTTLCNPIARELLGSSDVLPALQAADPTLTLAALAARPLGRELTVTAGGHERVLAVETRELRDANGGAGDVVVTLRDVTRQRRDEQLNRSFVALLTHKLRTPLTALSCAVELLEATPPGEQPPLFVEMSHRVHDLGTLLDRLADLTDLLGSTGRQHGHADLEALRRELEALLRSRCGDSAASLVWDVAADARELPVAPNRARIALTNLLDNAIKFSGTPAPWVRIGARRDGATLRIEVEDRGPGIPKAEQATVLEAWHQLDAEFTGNVPGAGIGLVMVREVARRAGGALELRDARPHGCVFSLVLPLAAPPGGRA
jgi:two-component system phosphate regulon sensor histidine kinase PhoR